MCSWYRSHPHNCWINRYFISSYLYRKIFYRQYLVERLGMILPGVILCLLLFILGICRTLNISAKVCIINQGGIPKPPECPGWNTWQEFLSSFVFSFKSKILLFICAATNACLRKILMVFVRTSVTAFGLRCKARVTRCPQQQRTSCCTAPPVCNLFVPVNTAAEGGWIILNFI